MDTKNKVVTCRTGWSWSLAPLLALLAGCATSASAEYPAVTPNHIAAVEGSVDAARAAGADRDEQALRHLRLAQVQLTEAKERAATGDNSGAAHLLARAEADAELSKMLQRRADATAEARITETELQDTRRARPQP